MTQHRSFNQNIVEALIALIIRIGFWDILYYNYNKEPPR